MLRKLGLLLAVAVLGLGLLAIAGCGGDDKKDKPQPTPEATGALPEVGTPDEEQVKAAVASCQASIKSQPQINSRLRTELEDTCDKGADGDVEEALQASEDVCVKIIRHLVPRGSSREQAMTACQETAKAP